MSFPDLSWIETVRGLEVEAIDGGRTINEFTLAPDEVQNEEDRPVLGRAVDDEEETEERLRALPQYLDYARAAFQQRGLVYPFQVSSSRDSLEVASGQKEVARRSADLSRIVG